MKALKGPTTKQEKVQQLSYMVFCIVFCNKIKPIFVLESTLNMLYSLFSVKLLCLACSMKQHSFLFTYNGHKKHSLPLSNVFTCSSYLTCRNLTRIWSMPCFNFFILPDSQTYCSHGITSSGITPLDKSDMIPS